MPQKQNTSRNWPVRHASSIFSVTGKAFAKGCFLDEDAHGESCKHSRQNKKTEPQSNFS